MSFSILYYHLHEDTAMIIKNLQVHLQAHNLGGGGPNKPPTIAYLPTLKPKK